MRLSACQSETTEYWRTKFGITRDAAAASELSCWSIDCDDENREYHETGDICAAQLPVAGLIVAVRAACFEHSPRRRSMRFDSV